MNNRSTDIGLLILRLSFGIIMLAAHGYPKFMRLFSGEEIKFFDPFRIGQYMSFVLAVGAEFLGALLLILGLFTRLSSLSLVITMFVAGFIYHGDDPFSSQEKAILFLTAYLVLFITGPGKYSIQRLIKNKVITKNKILNYLLG